MYIKWIKIQSITQRKIDCLNHIHSHLLMLLYECKSIPSTVSQSTLHIQHHSMLKVFLILKLSKYVPEKENNININKTKY